ncbi:lyso-ornithine lipid acyltransferase [Sphingomonas gellani]|uniref:Lyso-ornithine lipid acyltransferase n=1 Tax=Sphingomonas gellani TaxID=1166340 RepID=A0A1H8FUG0_9SPHN|nr:lysophospholipid acyltransferase family protein [Sphingomonas gellani]SEN35451.1 lyso-ornithine lipid acyltransferase [Sphingomonas gellani]
MRRVRLIGRIVALIAALSFGLILHATWRLARRPSPWPRRFLAAVAWITGARTRIQGSPLTRDVVFVANHLSWLDIPLLAGATGTAFVAKGELRRAPLVGWLSTLNHTLFVSRENRMGVAGQVAQLRAALAGVPCVAIFPEGTTGDSITLLPFKPALLAALDPPPPGVRVQPVCIDYGPETAALAWVGDEHGAHHAARVLGRAGHFVATLHFLPPFDPAPLGGRKAIAAEARRRIEQAMNTAQ